MASKRYALPDKGRRDTGADIPHNIIGLRGPHHGTDIRLAALLLKFLKVPHFLKTPSLSVSRRPARNSNPRRQKF